MKKQEGLKVPGQLFCHSFFFLTTAKEAIGSHNNLVAGERKTLKN
jgi:hypothetical protein